IPALMLDQAVRSVTLRLPSQFASSSVSLFLARRRQNESPRTPTNGPCESSPARGSDWELFAGDALHLPGGACPQRALRGRPHRLWRGNREIPKRLRSRALDELKADARSWKFTETDSVAAAAYPAAGEKTATEESGFCSRHGEGGFRTAHIFKAIIRAHRNRMFPRRQGWKPEVVVFDRRVANACVRGDEAPLSTVQTILSAFYRGKSVARGE